MCIALCGFGQSVPTDAQFERACIVNPDGFGWAIVGQRNSGMLIYSGKSMTSSVALAEFKSAMATLGERTVAWSFHARIATHGQTSLENAHGFQVGSDPMTWLCHNGMLPVTLAKSEDRSDTNVFATDILPRVLGNTGVAGLDEPGVADVIEGFVAGSGSKVIVLTANPDAQYPLYIFNEDAGHWVDDWWSSNRSYEPYESTTWSASHELSRYDKFEDLPVETSECCENLNCSGLVVEFEDWCQECNWCQTCISHVNECLCYDSIGKSRSY